MAEFTKSKRGAHLQYGGYQYTLNQRVKRIKEKLQSGDYSLDELCKLCEQVDGVQKLTVIQLASLFHVTVY